ncbi:hypothetical protein ACTWPB_04230 [Nocardia sp. IBHARD005]|uniref:hypothetical protein n=1 Tax=Nocardia sp. IBHARD005 TaxID=3457765 RepID=UPI00405A4B0E
MALPTVRRSAPADGEQRGMRSTAILSGIIAAAMLVVAGCSTDPAEDASPPEPVVDLAKLDVGPYPKIAQQITTTPSWALARYLEACG